MKNTAHFPYLARLMFGLLVVGELAGCTTNSDSAPSSEWHNLGKKDGIYLQGFDYPRILKEPSESAKMKYSSGMTKLTLRMGNETSALKCAKLEFLKTGNAVYASAGDFEDFSLLEPGEIRESGLVKPRGPWKLDYVIHVREPQLDGDEATCELPSNSAALSPS